MDDAIDRVTRLERGSLFAGYRIEGQLDRGGMGVVYKAADPDLDRTVALKIIAPEHTQNPDAVARFKVEARLAASLEHPNIVPIHRGGEFEGVLYLAMRFVPGTNLRKVVDEGQLDLPRVGRITTAVGAALDAAHERGLVHRDVKPGNILLSGEGEHEHVYLTDFGLTKRLGSAGSLTRPGAWVGTPDYVAPEQIQAGKVDGRADIYSLGCVLYEMLTGSVAFPKDNDMAKLWAHVTDPPPSPSLDASRAREGLRRGGGEGHREGPGRALPRASDLAAAVDGRSPRRTPGSHPAGSRRRARRPGCRPRRPASTTSSSRSPRGPRAWRRWSRGRGASHGLHADAARHSASGGAAAAPPAGRRHPAARTPPLRPRLRREVRLAAPPPPALGPSRRRGPLPPSAAGRWWPGGGRRVRHGRRGGRARHRLVRRRQAPRRPAASACRRTLSPVPTNKVDGLGKTTLRSTATSGDGDAHHQRAAERRAPRDAHPRG